MPDVINLPQLLEASIGSPEIGAVNFNQLHRLLLEIIGRLDGFEPSPPSDIDVKRDGKTTPPGFQKSSYSTLSEKVGRIERELNHMSTALPDSKEVIAKVKSETPLTDLWQHMQLNKRVETNEDGIKTVMNLIQQLIKDMSEMKDENKDLRNKLAKIDMDAINKQLKRLDELRDQMKAMSLLTDKLNDLDDFKDRLNNLQSRLDALPSADDIVTWPGLEDGLNGVRGEFASYRPESRTLRTTQSETKATAMTPTPTPVATTSAVSTPAATPVPGGVRPASGHLSRTSSRPKSNISDGPSIVLVDGLEKLGTVDKRHQELKKRVDDLEHDMAKKANKDDVSGKLPDDLLSRLDAMNSKLAELDDLRAKQVELGILLADVPRATDNSPPNRGDKSRASSMYMVSDMAENSAPRQMQSSSFSTPYPLRHKISSHQYKHTPSSIVETSENEGGKFPTAPPAGSSHQSVNDLNNQSQNSPASPSAHEPVQSSSSLQPSPDVEAVRIGSVTPPPSDNSSVQEVDDELNQGELSSSGSLHRQPSAESHHPRPPTDPSSPKSSDHRKAKSKKVLIKDGAVWDATTGSKDMEQGSHPSPHQQTKTPFQDDSKHKQSPASMKPSTGKGTTKSKEPSHLVSGPSKRIAEGSLPSSSIPRDPRPSSGSQRSPRAASDPASHHPPYTYRTTSPHPAHPAPPSPDDSRPRFARTLREVMHDDYMPEIGSLKARVDKLEYDLPRLALKRIENERKSAADPPIIQYITTDDGDADSKIADLVKHINDYHRDVDRHLADIDEALIAFINSVGDSSSIKRAQKAITDLQEELKNLQKLVDFLSKENEEKSKMLKKLEEETTRLDMTKAGKDYVDAELDTKADKSQIDGKVNRSLFDSTINDLQKIIDDLLAKLLAYEEAWKQAHIKVEEDVDGKIDRTELDRLKAYLDRKLKDLNAKLKQNSGMFNPFCEDAAGLKKQLLPFNCLSCDKPVVVSNAANPLTQSSPGGVGDAFTANKSTRPYTTFELDQIRQHAKSLLNADYVMDYYSMPRSAGGSHTMTYPHKRLSKQAYRDVIKDPTEDIPPEVFLPVKDEAEIVGADGHVYRGRFDLQGSVDTNSQAQEGRPSTPSNGRPKTSPVRRPGSSRPGSMSRPKTAITARVNFNQAEQPGSRERPSSARERPMSSMGVQNGGERTANEPVVVTIGTATELENQAATPPNGQDTQA